jgi:hypothetical protein
MAIRRRLATPDACISFDERQDVAGEALGLLPLS